MPTPTASLSRWARHATRAARALIREEGKALRDLRNVVRSASQRIVHASVTLPPGSRRTTAERVAGMLRAEGDRVAREMTQAITTVRQSSKATSHGLFVGEWTDARGVLVRGGFQDPGPLGTTGMLAPTDDAAAHRTGQSFAAGWSSAVLAASWQWAEGDAESIAPALGAVDVDGRVRRIAATEAAQAFADARDEGAGWLAEEFDDRPWYPLVLKRWDATNDRRVCALCKGEDEEMVPLGKSFAQGRSPGYAHNFCLVPGTPIAVPGGEVPIEELRIGDVVIGGLTGQPRRVTALHRTPHRGDVYVIRVHGRLMRITGNHPVLTPSGWIPAESLKPGDEVICHLPEPRILGVDFVPTPPDHLPSVAPKEGISLTVNTAMGWRAMPVSGVNLDIQLRPPRNKIEIVCRDRHLRIDQDVCGGECFQEHALNLGERPLGVGDGAIGLLRSGLALPPERLVARGSQAASPLWAFAPHPYESGGPAPTRPNARCSERRYNGRSLQTEMLGDGQDGQLLIDMHPTDGFGVKSPSPSSDWLDAHAFKRATHDRFTNIEQASNGGDALALFDVEPGNLDSIKDNWLSAHKGTISTGIMLATPIDSIAIEQYRGHVLNLSVEADESYVASGVSVHNCRCVEHLIVLPIPGRRERITAGRQVDDFNPRGPDEVPLEEAA